MNKKRRKIGSRIVVITVALLMVFTVGFLAACGTMDTLQADLDALQADIIQVRDNPPDNLEAELERLQGEIDAFRNGSRGMLNATQKQQLDEMQTKVDDMRKENGGTVIFDFALNISISATTLQFGQNLTMEAVFKNQSGVEVEISHTQSWIMPLVNGVAGTGLLDVNLTVLESNASITRRSQFGSDIPRGIHTLSATATFGAIKREGGNVVSSQSFIVRSNKITLTVV